MKITYVHNRFFEIGMLEMQGGKKVACNLDYFQKVKQFQTNLKINGHLHVCLFGFIFIFYFFYEWYVYMFYKNYNIKQLK